jgi:hypothetical protein
MGAMHLCPGQTSNQASHQTTQRLAILLSVSRYDAVSPELEDSAYEDFYRYTSARWLWYEEARLLERYKRFNVPGLKQLAARASGAQSCVSITKLAEGGFNRVFRLPMDNGAVVIARIP